MTRQFPPPDDDPKGAFTTDGMFKGGDDGDGSMPSRNAWEKSTGDLVLSLGPQVLPQHS